MTAGTCVNISPSLAQSTLHFPDAGLYQKQRITYKVTGMFLGPPEDWISVPDELTPHEGMYREYSAGSYVTGDTFKLEGTFYSENVWPIDENGGAFVYADIIYYTVSGDCMQKVFNASWNPDLLYEEDSWQTSFSLSLELPLDIANASFSLQMMPLQLKHDYYLEPTLMVSASYIPVQRPLVVNLETDKKTYEQGEAVTVNIQVLYDNVPICPDNSKINFTAESPDGRITSLAVKTDNSGKCSFMPFAGHLTGIYKLYVQCYNTTGTGTEEKRITAVNQTRISVLEESFAGVDKVTQLNKIIELYKAQIPEGPIRGPGFHSYRLKYPESMYGSLHNMFIGGKWADPGGHFICGGYQTQVLAFFDSIRFNADPEIRKLLKGFDYGPISRAGGPEWLIGHHAVVLFVTGNDWWPYDPNAWVFDPWPTQRPEVTNVMEFAGLSPLGRAAPDYYYTTQTRRDWFFTDTGYPITGGVVYTNPSFFC